MKDKFGGLAPVPRHIKRATPLREVLRLGLRRHPDQRSNDRRGGQPGRFYDLAHADYFHA